MIQTSLVTIGSTLAAGLLIWIASSQLDIVKNQIGVQRDVTTATHLMREVAEKTEMEIARVDNHLNQVWPRLRVHGENIAILTRELEDLCECKIDLKKPEKF